MAIRAGSLECGRSCWSRPARMSTTPRRQEIRPSTSPSGLPPNALPAFSPDDTGAVRTSALVLAMLNGHFKLATWLVNHGADPNAPDPRGSALHALAWLRKPGLPLDSGPVMVTFGNVDSDELARRCSITVRTQTPASRGRRSSFDQRRRTGAGCRPTIRMGRHWLSYVGATPFLLAAQQQRRAVDAAAARARRRSEHPCRPERHAADGRRRPRLLGCGESGAAERHAGVGHARSRANLRRAWRQTSTRRRDTASSA